MENEGRQAGGPMTRDDRVELLTCEILNTFRGIKFSRWDISVTGGDRQWDADGQRTLTIIIIIICFFLGLSIGRR